MLRFDTNLYEKIREDQFLRFINTTPSGGDATWALIAAVEEDGAGIEYNANVDRLKLIVNENAITNHKSNDKQLSATYLAYEGDPCFTFANAGRDKLNYKTQLLEVDLWDETDGSYTAKMSNATLTVSNYNGNQIEFNLYVDGDPTEGTATVSGNTPTFIPTTSL